MFTEASGKKRASLHVVAGRAALAELDRGGLDVFTATTAEFAERLRRERHTVKRALTDPTCSTASATRTPTRSSTPRSCRRFG